LIYGAKTKKKLWRKKVALLGTSKEVVLEVIAETTKYVFMSSRHKAGPNKSVRVGNESFESVAKFKILEPALKKNSKNVGATIKFLGARRAI
jgi:hypothetical protein